MRAQQWFREAERFVRSYTEGMRESDFSRLFDRDAVRAFDVVTREHDREQEPEDGSGASSTGRGSSSSVFRSSCRRRGGCSSRSASCLP